MFSSVTRELTTERTEEIARINIILMPRGGGTVTWAPEGSAVVHQASRLFGRDPSKLSLISFQGITYVVLSVVAAVQDSSDDQAPMNHLGADVVSSI